MGENSEVRTFDFDELYSKNYDKIFRFLLGKGASQEEAEEVCQETFIKVLHHWESFDPSKGNVSSWMITIAKNQFFDLMRKKNSTQGKEIENSQEYIESIAQAKAKNEDEKNRLDLLKDTVESLPPLEKEIIQLRFMKKYTIKETSEQLGISVRTVNRKTYASLTILRMKLQGSDFGFGSL
ncbi:sigma-70 family RNA polymerase sigma factor [Leptospira sp. 201903070]|uniref:Sigma-70 family RNA polymerase sigma factor n=1 Tax=Leptospira ainlahdjerensis TaxID=2810033 RepID=A0ABS2UBG7_9LEPT|nr:sigma-70 family RNA polymerase sigma factor [Leptospira ainlahdjerensis]MBM9577707.1 sigma-70 family RNA polymerase sigma factor [Leptospira ainlahdjerensis]MBM9577713.1 sigma-70 family RNA polymerase sigma factor [Leptospira ainlahdjerensis]